MLQPLAKQAPLTSQKRGKGGSSTTDTEGREASRGKVGPRSQSQEFNLGLLQADPSGHDGGLGFSSTIMFPIFQPSGLSPIPCTLPPGTYLRQKPGVVLEQELGELTVAEVVDAVSLKHTQVVIACQCVTVLTVLPAEQSKARVTSELCLPKILTLKS